MRADENTLDGFQANQDMAFKKQICSHPQHSCSFHSFCAVGSCCLTFRDMSHNFVGAPKHRATHNWTVAYGTLSGTLLDTSEIARSLAPFGWPWLTTSSSTPVVWSTRVLEIKILRSGYAARTCSPLDTLEQPTTGFIASWVDGMGWGVCVFIVFLSYYTLLESIFLQHLYQEAENPVGFWKDIYKKRRVFI